MSYVRRASHAGSWYSSSSSALSSELAVMLEASSANPVSSALKAVISPHAGVAYSGKTAGFVLGRVVGAKTVIVMGPSHHVAIRGAAVSRASRVETPLGDIEVNQSIINELVAAGMQELDQETDEDEHSLEMQYPFLKKAQLDSSQNFTIVPILIGDLGRDRGVALSRMLSKYISQPDVRFVISSDFCHWGSRFRFTWHDPALGEIHNAIEALDRRGMQAISTLDPDTFDRYLKDTENTICGRNPILLFLQILKTARSENTRLQCRIDWLNYRQSSQATKKSDSSVSYAAGICIVE